MKHLILAIAYLVSMSPVSAQSLGEKAGVNSLMDASLSTEDFVKEAATSDMFEIQSSELALQKSTDTAIKNFAQQMVQDHSMTTSDLKAFVESGKVKATIPDQLDQSHQSKLDKLKTLTGTDFDKQYDKDQTTGHKDAVSLFKRYAEGGENAELKIWASKTLPKLEDHLKEAKALRP
ncbi:DUF4142 domain-containing protein [Beijerinckia indica]|uniref:DUF4142 domain-containing protein n=1 Tax=Beijerinckia indica subsp. indica (strain ATCC 9039 / DSM 1715 / NCIMB 8712) TaxID=395963 RepID=B2ILG6_BEII9|nr:DUF4142 domain-containing protein [Beijerinckia indica]ACB97366.1 conserved hypothetical protein [Beijerinckia indica subsp. indica ATCC 9039]